MCLHLFPTYRRLFQLNSIPLFKQAYTKSCSHHLLCLSIYIWNNVISCKKITDFMAEFYNVMLGEMCLMHAKFISSAWVIRYFRFSIYYFIIVIVVIFFLSQLVLSAALQPHLISQLDNVYALCHKRIELANSWERVRESASAKEQTSEEKEPPFNHKTQSN